MNKRFLVRHVGNMGDMIFFIPPVLSTLKRLYQDCHITFVTAWGFKDQRGRWGKRNQGGFCLHLMMTNPHIDQLVHYHDQRLALDKSICHEDGERHATWSEGYYREQKQSGNFDQVFELDFGIGHSENPLTRMYEAIGHPQEDFSHYQIYFKSQDRAVAEYVMKDLPQPRIVLLEGLDGTTTRGWDPGKVSRLVKVIRETYGVAPIWFGSQHAREFEGRELTLRENIATLTFCDVAIGVLSGPLHFAAAAGLPTLTLYADHPLQRAAPAYFLNRYVTSPRRHHRTLLGPAAVPFRLLKNDSPSANLTPAEAATQGNRGWQRPGRQATKTGLAVLTVDEILTVIQDMLG